MTMKYLPFLLCLTFFHFSLKAQNPTVLSKSPFVLGETIKIQSKQLQESRTLNIYLPAQYQQDSTKKYPVIYLLDGSADEDFIHVVGLVQFGTFPWINSLPESIVVGVANVDRKRDYTFPTNNAKDKANTPTAGGSAAFIRFIETELQPFIRKNYRTDSVATLVGQSLGGLVATEILFKKPGLFTHYVIISPSLWWDDESLLKLEPKPAAAAKTIYLAVGKEEHPVMVSDAVQLSEKLEKIKADKHRLIFKIWAGQDHANIMHVALYEAFGQIFKI